MNRHAVQSSAPFWRPRLWLARSVDLVFPPACAFCHRALETSAEGLLCAACRELMTDTRTGCPRCGLVVAQLGACPACHDQRLSFDAVVRLGGYDGALRTAVLRIKRQSQRGLALTLGQTLAAACGAALGELNLDAIVPVPMHWSRRMWRGANSPETISEPLARQLRLPLTGHLLARRRRTAPQANLSPPKRKANMRGAFRARPHPDLAGARLLLVDDIMTTGATVNEAAKALKRGGAGFVAVAVLARADALG